MGVTSANTLRPDRRDVTIQNINNATNQVLKSGMAGELTLMAVMAKAIFLLPSMFVLRTRRMCWNFSGMTRD